MRNKHNISITAGILLLVLISLFFYLSTYVQPKIIFTSQITKINDEDYKRIKNNADIRTVNKGIEYFRHISLHIKVVGPFALVNHVKIGDSQLQGFIIQPYLKDNTKISILGGGSYGNGNVKEFSENTEICLNDISENELKSMLGNLRVEVSWQNIWNNKDSKIFYLKDNMK